MSSRPCDCIMSSYSPHRAKRCFMRRIGILPPDESVTVEKPTAEDVLVGSYDPNEEVYDSSIEARQVDGPRLLASSVEPEATNFRDYIHGIPCNERVTPSVPLKEENRRPAVQATLVERTEISSDDVVAEDTIPCSCNLSTYFPHQQGYCKVVTDRANMTLAALGVAFAVGGISVAAQQASKKKRKN